MRLLREVSQDCKVDYRCRRDTFLALQEASEAVLVRVFEDAKQCAIHSKRQTIMPKDLYLALRLNGAVDGVLFGMQRVDCNKPSFSKNAFTAVEDASRRSRAT